jgi:hypothetical protein
MNESRAVLIEQKRENEQDGDDIGGKVRVCGGGGVLK